MTLRTTLSVAAVLAVAAVGILLAALVVFVSRFDLTTDGGVSFNGDFVFKLADGYDLWRTSSENVVIADAKGFDVVPTEVVSVGIQGDLITASQCIASDRSRIPAEDDFRYWIIQVHERKVYGPLVLAEFAAKRKDLGIDSSPKSRNSISFYHERAGRATSHPQTSPE